MTIRNLKIAFNTLVGLVLIFVWSRFVDIKQILETIRGVNVIYFIPIFIFMFLSPFIRAVRLKVFLSEIKIIPLSDLVFLNGVAILLNFVIPIRAGEVAKGVYLNTSYKLSLGKSIIWIFLDRFVDFLIVLIAGSILLLGIPTSMPQSFTISLSVIFMITTFLAYIAIFQQDFAKKMVNFLSYLLIEKHIKIYFVKVTSFILDSFSILKRHPKDLTLMGILTVLAYAADAAIWYFTFVSLGINQDFIKMYLGQLISAVTYLIPAAPGYVGSAEASGTLILTGVFGIDVNLASAMIVLFHILSAIFVLIFGLIAIFSLKIDLGLILRKALNRS